MGNSALKKWAALRSLHEHWGASLALLRQAGDVTAETIKRRSKKEGWTRDRTAASQHARLIRVFEQQVDRFESNEGEIDEEKRARALSVTAKTLETIAAIGARISNIQREVINDIGSVGNGESNGSSGPTDSNRTSDLDRQLAELVQNIT